MVIGLRNCGAQVGISPAPSAMRPQRASRAMSTIGEKVQRDAFARGFGRGQPRGLRDEVDIPASGQAEVDWEDGPEAVQ